ncbi:MAG: PAS domain S-box protein, partial [Mariprofundaceae bacterium]|nr:PAS domain S-box protein [Mariprofundaceae bacterium]
SCHGYEDNPVRGIFYIRLSTQAAEFRIANIHDKSVIFSILFAFILLAAVWLLLRYQVLNPLDSLLAAIRHLHRGTENNKAIPIKRGDEFGEIANEFEALEKTWAMRERRVQLILNHVPDGVLTVNKTGQVISANKTARKMFGRTMEELQNENILKHLYPPGHVVKDNVGSLDGFDLTVLSETLRECVGEGYDGKTFPLELKVCPFQSDYMVFTRTSEFEELNEQDNFLVFLRDLSSRKRSESEMHLLAAVVNQASDAILITNPLGKIEYVNSSFHRITQYKREEVIGKNPKILKSGEYGASYYERMWFDLMDGKLWKDVFINRRKDGSTYQAEQAIAPIFDSYGNISHFVAIQRDITRERDLQAQMEHLQRLESLGVLASGIAHDFNNILTVVMGNVELLGIDLDDNSENRKSLAAITSAGARGAGLCRELMAYAGKGKNEITWVDLKQLFEELGHLLQVTIPQHITMSFELDDKLPCVRADVMQLEQVMMNLLINAREAIGSNDGKIHVSGKRINIDRAWFETAYFDHLPENLDFVQLTIRDNGCGMSSDVKARVFDPFYTTKFTGRGLGMSAVLGIIKTHQGAIRCDSEVDIGTSFSVLLPCPAQKKSFEEKNQNDADSVQDSNNSDINNASLKDTVSKDTVSKGTVLVVEDEDAVRHILESFLSHAGYLVQAFEHGSAAVKYFAKHQSDIDLVILDMSMPQMSGPQVLKKLRKKGLKVPVIVCSGEPREDVMIKLGQLDVDGVIAKPFKYKGLIKALADLTRTIQQ